MEPTTSPSRPDRRTFLKGAALTGVGAGSLLALGPARPAAAADASLGPFAHGVASGDPTASSVILWTRVTPPDPASAVPVTWVVARDVDLVDVVRSGEALAEPDRDHTVKIDVDGLDPDRHWFYGFTALGWRSITGRTLTAPITTDRLRFGVVSCSNYQGGFFNAYARLAERDDLAAIIHLGDYLYEYGNGADRYGPGTGELQSARDHVPATEMTALADYRARHGNYKLDPDLRRLHQLFPWIVTWDDHESANNSHRDGAENHDPATEGDWEVRKSASRQAYSEWMPIRAADPARIHRTLSYGDLAEIVVMDTRLDDRDPELGTTGATILSGAELDDPARRMISDDQRSLVERALTTTGARWKVLAQQVILGQWNAAGAPDLGALPDLPQFSLRDGGNALNPDQWDGYPAERQRLFDVISDNEVTDVVVLTGDVHTSWALDLTPDPYNPLTYDPLTGSGALGVEFVVPSVTSANFASLGPAGVAAFEAVTLADNPHVKFVDFDDHGYFVLDLDHERAQADWFFVDTVLAPSDVEAHAASWATDTGSGHVRAADGPAPAGPPAPARPGEGAPAPADSGTVAVAAAVATPVTSAATGRASGETLPVTGGGTGVGVAVALGVLGAAATTLRRRMEVDRDR